MFVKLDALSDGHLAWLPCSKTRLLYNLVFKC